MEIDMATAKTKTGRNRPARGGVCRYDPAHCDTALETLAEGHSLAGLAGKIGVDRRTITNWRNQYPEFDDACERGQMMAVYWWERQARNLAMTGEGNAATVIFGLKNRAPEDWRDKQEVEHSGGVSVTRVELVPLK